jgi:hypothetical protein
MRPDGLSKQLTSAAIYWYMFAGSLILVLINSIRRHFDWDEFGHIHRAWKILNGERIYVDFFDSYHPFLSYLLAPLIAMVGESANSVLAARVLMFILLSTIFVATYLLSVCVFGKPAGVLGLVFLSTTLLFVHKAIEVRPDVPQVLFGLISLLFLYKFFESRSALDLVLSATSLAISLLFLRKAIFLVGLTGLLLIIRLIQRKFGVRDLVLYATAFVLTLAPYFVLLWYTSSLQSFFVFNWLLQIKYRLASVPATNRIIWTLLRTSLDNAFVWAFYVVGLVTVRKTRSQWELAIISVGLLLSVLAFNSPHDQYYMMAIPLVAMVSAHGVETMFEKSYRARTLIVILTIMIPSLRLANTGIGIMRDHSNRLQLAEISYVLSITRRDDYVYDPDSRFNVFRKDLDFFWNDVHSGGMLDAYQSMTGYSYDAYRLIEVFKPKVIVEDGLDYDDPRIASNYKLSAVYRHVFIRRE